MLLFAAAGNAQDMVLVALASHHLHSHPHLVAERLPPHKLSPTVKLQSTLFEMGNQQHGSHESVMTGSECRRPRNPSLKDSEPRSRMAMSTS